MNINEITLKSQLKIMIGIGVFALLITLYGVRLMGKANDFSYLDHQHSQSISIADIELSKNEIDRGVITEQVKSAYQAAISVDNVVFSVERLFFRLLGQGWIIDLAEESETNLKSGIFILENKDDQFLINTEKHALDLVMSKSLGYSSEFGQGIKKLSTTIKYFVDFIILICVGGLTLLIVNILKTTIPSLEKTVQVLEEISDGNLKVNVDHSASGEVGRMQGAMTNMINGLQEMIGNIHLIVEELINAANVSAKITDQTLTGVKTQKSETELLSSSIREMSIAVNEVASSASNAALSASDGNKAAEKGKEVVGEAVESINVLAAEVESSVAAIQRIEAGSDKIGSVIKIIKDITAQTNLLALNAAIEAARAGDQGRGFAVVADEVRALASRTQDSTEEIRNTINGLKGEVVDCVATMRHASEMAEHQVSAILTVESELQTIASAVREITNLNQEMESAANEQSDVSESINHNVIEISRSAEQTSGDAKETARIAGDLLAMAENLRKTIEQFRLNQEGRP